jgi:hypothetical protein
MGKCLSIVEFSSKHGISISTLRRKIKNKKIKYKIEDGKYYIFENEKGTHEYSAEQAGESNNCDNSDDLALDDLGSTPSAEDVLTFAEKSISSITKFHQETVDEKDKRLALQEHLINQLKEEIEELRMLVRVLEGGSK